MRYALNTVHAGVESIHGPLTFTESGSQIIWSEDRDLKIRYILSLYPSTSGHNMA